MNSFVYLACALSVSVAASVLAVGNAAPSSGVRCAHLAERLPTYRSCQTQLMAGSERVISLVARGDIMLALTASLVFDETFDSCKPEEEVFAECCMVQEGTKEKRLGGVIANKRSVSKASSIVADKDDVCGQWAREQAVLESTIDRLQRTYDQLSENTREEFEQLVKERKEHMQLAQAPTQN